MDKNKLVQQAGTVEVNLAGLLLLIGTVMANPHQLDLEDAMKLLDASQAAD